MPEVKRTALIGANVGITIAVAAFILVAVNFIAYRTSTAWDWTAARRFTLSSKTENVLAGLTQLDEKVEAVYFAPVSGGQVDQALITHVNDLLIQFDRLSKGQLTYPGVIDPQASPSAANEILSRFKVSLRPFQHTVLFKYKDAVERVEQEDLAKINYQTGQTREFTAEENFVLAINKVIQGKKRAIGFVTGHNEPDVNSLDEEGGGLSLARKLLEGNNFEIVPITLAPMDHIPAPGRDENPYDLVVVAGPRHPYNERELGLLDGYLNAGGRLLILMESNPTENLKGVTQNGLEPFLERWGIKAGQELVFEWNRNNHISGNQPFSPEILVRSGNPHHPIMRYAMGFIQDPRNPRERVPVMAGDLFLPTSRSIEPKSQISYAVDKLFWSSDKSAAVYDIGNPTMYGSTSKAGPITLGVAMERILAPRRQEEPPEEEAPQQQKKARMVVIGDVNWMQNANLQQYPMHPDLLLNTVHWLVEQEASLGIAPKKEAEKLKMILTDEKMSRIRWITLAYLPGAMLILGLAVWWVRRT